MILVTGGGGFVGRRVCAHLRREGRACIGCDAQGPAGCDITDRRAVEALFAAHPIEAVIHLAALLPSACRKNPAQATRVNICGSANVLEAAAAHGVRRFVFGSSISVYSVGADSGDIYGAGKRAIEMFGDLLAQSGGISFVALRMAMVVGPGARGTASLWRSEIFEKLGSGARQSIRIPLGGDAVRSLVYVDDAAQMLALLATREQIPSQVYDSPAENWSMGDLKRAVEGLDGNVEVALNDAGPEPAVPLADGARFAGDFGWEAPRLADRLADCLLK